MIRIIFILVLFMASACSIPVTLHKNLALTGEVQPSSEQCRECHTVIYNEWKNSAHSRAYSNPYFRSITNDYSVNVCVDCHSPESAFDTEIRLRQSNLDEGVTCQSCHLRDGVLQGPVEKHLPFDIHPIMQKNENYRRSDLCGNCHKKAFKEYRASGETGKTCQSCHMPEVKRTIIDNKPFVWIKGKYAFRMHSFNVRDEETIPDWIGLSIHMKENSIFAGEVAVENKSVPHSIPTGAYGYHEVLVEISAIGTEGEILETVTHSMTQEMKTALKKGEKRTVTFSFSRNNQSPAAVRAALVRADFDRKHRTILIRNMLYLNK